MDRVLVHAVGHNMRELKETPMEISMYQVQKYLKMVMVKQKALPAYSLALVENLGEELPQVVPIPMEILYQVAILMTVHPIEPEDNDINYY